MRRTGMNAHAWLALVFTVAAAACGESGSSGSLSRGNTAGNDQGSGSGGDTSGGSSGSGGPTASGASSNGDAPTNPGAGGSTPGTGGTTGNNGADPNANSNPNIDKRVINYGEALRTASLKLVGDLPTLADINKLAGTAAAQQKATYEAMIDALLADPRFAAKQIQWWRDTLKTGQQGAVKAPIPSFDTAATFAASVVVADRPYTDIFTATTGTCATFANGTFTPADCNNGAPTAGILTDPGLMSQYLANMAFRRVRFVQETFACSKFPAEFAAQSKPMGAGTYTSPWDFNSITGGATAKINFQDTSAVICANCHTTMNHLAPLFANFDANGKYDATKIAVQVPVAGTPAATLADWLPAGQQTFAWRNGVAVTDLPSLGAAIAKDPDVARCAVNRVWNFAMSRGDIVNDLATIPPVVTDPIVASFTANGMKLKSVIRTVFTSDDFVKF